MADRLPEPVGRKGAGMRIAQIAPLSESVPARGHGGTERVVHYLTEELIRQGHEVTLYASGDSETSARLVPGCPRALRSGACEVDPLPMHLCMVEQALADAANHDVLHFHLDLVHLPILRREPALHLTTLHHAADRPGVRALLQPDAPLPLVAISEAQAEGVPDVRFSAVIHHGIPRDEIRFQPSPQGYLLFLGRLSPEKGACRAVEIARRSGLPLKIAGKYDPLHPEYFEACLPPLFREPFVEYLGEVGDAERRELLRNARGLLFPVRSAEPFGLVLIEAMAAGTPVVAFRAGAVPELVAEGVTGHVVADAGEAALAASNLEALDRSGIRRHFEERYTADRMAREYVAVYERLLARQQVLSVV